MSTYDVVSTCAVQSTSGATLQAPKHHIGIFIIPVMNGIAARFAPLPGEGVDEKTARCAIEVRVLCPAASFERCSTLSAGLIQFIMPYNPPPPTY